MAKRETYQTVQKSVLLNYLIEHRGEHFTVPDLKDELERQGSSIGLATIYRQLDQLEKTNEIRKYTPDGKQAYYEYVGTTSCAPSHYHLRCIYCGEMEHLACGELKELSTFIYKSHRFQIDPSRTILSGICAACAAKQQTGSPLPNINN